VQIDILLLTKTSRLPEKMSNNAAGYDIFADIAEPVILKPFDRILIPSGFALAIPEGFEAQIRPRSGLAFKYGITVLNSPGTIDSDYRGEVKILLINLSQTDFQILPQMRIAQLIISQHAEIEFSLKPELALTARGSGGFGHTSH